MHIKEIDHGNDMPGEKKQTKSSLDGDSTIAKPQFDSSLTQQKILKRREEFLKSSPGIMKQTLSKLNASATNLYKSEDYVGSVAIYSILFENASKNNRTHPELFICHSNCAAAYMKLEQYENALEHAARCTILAESALRRNLKSSGPSYIKSFSRKGEALLALGRHREAALVFEKGLEYDPMNVDLKYGLQRANEGIVKDIMEGKHMEHRAITFPEPAQRITFHPYSAPLHRVRTEDLLPLKLLTPFQAENDHDIKDTYNYMTVQSDVRMPTRELMALEDSYLVAAWKEAIQGAVEEVEARDTDCRVLNLGSKLGLGACFALKSGARHVTAAERWLYLALATKETLEENGFDDEAYKVIYKRPSDLRIIEDVPVCANVLVADMLDEGLLTSGIIPAIRHALTSLTTTDAIVLPASATVCVQAVELRTTSVCGFDMSQANLYRHHPTFGGGASLDMSTTKLLSRPMEVWYFDLGSPPETSDVKKIDVEFEQDGKWNAVIFWYKLHLWGDVYITTGPEASNLAPGIRRLQPALQYLAGELRVDAGTILPLTASHNTVGMRFDIEEADYLHLMKADSSFPQRHFNMLADHSRLAAYERAIERAVREKAQKDGEVHALDIGTGSGILALLTARAGAKTVVACDLHESLCDVARKTAAAAGVLGRKISVVHKDAALLQRGREVRPLGVNLVVADVFDAGLLGDQFPYILDLTKRKVVQPGATVIPAAATVFCMGVEIFREEAEGVLVKSSNKYRWDSDYKEIRLSDIPHRRLTRPAQVSEYYFDGSTKSKGREGLIKLETIASGYLNAIIFWFDLHLDDTETITSAPEGIAKNGSVSDDTPGDEHYWGQACQYLDRGVHVEAGHKVSVLSKREGSKLRFSLRPGVGDWVDRAPWKIEWGGGASVENPHFQRVHYCDLLVRDFLMRCKSQRFPSIQKDITMVLAHCGSLFLDPISVQEAGHELVVLEKLHTNPEFSPAASLEALTRPVLKRC